jgi:asparagine synthetase B (glutamine-hydrolysing)
MNSNADALQALPGASSQRPWARWLTILSDRPPVQVQGVLCQLIAGEGRRRQLFLTTEVDSETPAYAAQGECAVVFDGALYNRSDLERELGSPAELSKGNAAEVILAGYLRWGKDLLARLRGPLALVIWDGEGEVLFGVRDPLGNHPLFFAEVPGQVLVSPAIDMLTRRPDVSRDLNRVAMADFVMQRTLGYQDTFFESVRRIPAGHALMFERNSLRLQRYWDPAPGGQVNWSGPSEVERFDELFDRAVSRCMSFGPAGIFLSGGLDSVAVAAAAIDLCEKQGVTQPWALSLVFPHPETNEEEVQRSVASQLGLRQIVKPFFEATGENGLLRPALAMNRYLPAPLLNAWLPAYTALAKEGTQRGCKVIVTGGGGDEWLGVGPFLAADLMRAFDLRGIYRLWRDMRLSYRISGFALLRSLVWKYGAKPLLLPPTYKFVKRAAPWAIRMRHRFSPTPPSWIPPKWAAPDPALRRQIEERAAQANGNSKSSSGSHYVRAGKNSLDHPMISWELEELFDVYRRIGVRILQPFWDADLVDLLFRMPPFDLNRGGRSKGLVRDSLARRFPDLGFERQRKVLGVNFYRSLVEQDGANIWQELGGAKALKGLGIIDEKGLDDFLRPRLNRPRDARDAHEVLTVLNLESWTRCQAA